MHLRIIAFTALLISWSCNVATKAAAPLEKPFTPAVNPFAYRMVSERFELVERLGKVDPTVQKMFFRRVPKKSVATGRQAFAMSDIDDGLPRRFNFAGRTRDMWFILYEVGGRAHHHVILVFYKDGNRWRNGPAVVGYLEKNEFPNLVRNIRKGYFDVVFDNLNL